MGTGSDWLEAFTTDLLYYYHIIMVITSEGCVPDDALDY
jgi:hypothetical protein